MPTAFITARDRQDAASILDLAWLTQRAASEDSVAEGFTEEVAGSTVEEVVAVALTEEVVGVTVGDR
jgi:hypothetical protein